MRKICKKSTYLILSLLLLFMIIKIVFFDDVIKDEPIKKSLNIDISQPIDDYQYILKEYDGKLAVFNKESNEPEMIFDVLVDSLPEIDIIELRQGLKIKNDQELKDRIEDFVS